MLNEKSIIPLYYQLKEFLKEKIKEGSWEENSKVPSERELMNQFNVSRATVRKALDELLMEGLIYRKQGIGTFVATSKIAQNLIGELSFNQQAIRQGLKPSSKVVDATPEQSSPKRIKELLSQSEEKEINRIIRVRLVNEKPLVLETLYIPKHYAPSILEQNLEDIAVFEYLEKNSNLQFTHSTLDIEPILINEFESNFLDVEIGQPALSLERVIYSDNDAVVIQKRIMRGDRGKFVLMLGEESPHKAEYFVGLEFNNS